MENLQVFRNNEFGELGILELGGREYFPATACAKKLGYKDPYKAIKLHCKSDGWVNCPVVTQTKNQHGIESSQTVDMKFIDEGNLYRLIVSSKLPSAERFERWVFDEVLPSLRKHGNYGNDSQQIPTQLIAGIVAETVKQLMPYVSRMTPGQDARYPHRRKRNDMFEGVIERISPELRQKVDEMLELEDTYTYVDIASVLQSYGINISGTSVQRYHLRKLTNR